MKNIVSIVAVLGLALTAGCRTIPPARTATWRDVDARFSCQDRATAWLRAAHEIGITNGLGRCFYFVGGKVPGQAHVVPYYDGPDGERIYVEPLKNARIMLTDAELECAYHRPGFTVWTVPVIVNNRIYPITHSY
jgi:hypothetical protein